MTVTTKNALVVGASGGIGAALVAELKDRGHLVTNVSRREDDLDITAEASVITHLVSINTQFDVVVLATGALSVQGEPEKTLRTLSTKTMAAPATTPTTPPYHRGHLLVIC